MLSAVNQKFDIVEERDHPAGATRVGDLVAAARGSEHVTYRRIAPQSLGARYYQPKQLGDYVYVPDFLNRPNLEQHPTPARGIHPYRPLASMDEIRIEFKDYGNRRMAAFYSSWASDLYLVSNALRDILLDHDPGAVETTTPHIVGADGDPILGYTVVMPARVIDAADIARTDISVLRYERPPSIGPCYTSVRYESGITLRDDITAVTFLDEYSGCWFWSLDLMKAVAAAEIRGMRFSHPCSHRIEHEIRLPADGDQRFPGDW